MTTVVPQPGGVDMGSPPAGVTTSVRSSTRVQDLLRKRANEELDTNAITNGDIDGQPDVSVLQFLIGN